MTVPNILEHRKYSKPPTSHGLNPIRPCISWSQWSISTMPQASSPGTLVPRLPRRSTAAATPAPCSTCWRVRTHWWLRRSCFRPSGPWWRKGRGPTPIDPGTMGVQDGQHKESCYLSSDKPKNPWIIPRKTKVGLVRDSRSWIGLSSPIHWVISSPNWSSTRVLEHCSLDMIEIELFLSGSPLEDLACKSYENSWAVLCKW